MSLRTALTNLAAVSVSGVSNSYDVSAVPSSLTTAQLPALLPFIMGRGGGGGEAGFRVGAFDGGSAEVTYRVDHVLFVEAVGQGRGLLDILPAVATLIDAYVSAMAADSFLNGALHYALAFEIGEPVISEYPADSKQNFYTVTFAHTWRRNV